MIRSIHPFGEFTRRAIPRCARWLLVGLVAAAVLRPAPPAGAAEREKAGALDQQLLDRLLRDPIDKEIQQDLPGSEWKPSEGTAPQERPPEGDPSLEETLRRQLGAAAVPETANPLLEIARAMRHVQDRLTQADSSRATQAEQRRIVDRLEELIRQARSRCRGRGSEASQQQQVASRRAIRQPQRQQQGKRKPGKPRSQPVTNPNAAAGRSEPQRPSPEQLRGMLEGLWGQLPPAEREQMLELPVEELFLPKYDIWIEQYFKRLAEQQPPPARSPQPH